MASYTKERCNVVISSTTRLNPGTSTSSNFTFKLNRNISRIREIGIKSLQLPYTFYYINALNNVLSLNANALTVTITPGNYSTATLAIELKTQLDAAFGDATTVVTFSSTTYKLSITRGTAFSIDSVASFAVSTFASVIGFNVDSATSTTITGDGVINISGPNYVVIESAFFTKAVQNKVTYSSNLYDNALAVIPLLVGPGDIISMGEQPFIQVRFNYKFNITTTDVIDIKIKDDKGNILNLNGADFAMQLVLVTE